MASTSCQGHTLVKLGKNSMVLLMRRTYPNISSPYRKSLMLKKLSSREPGGDVPFHMNEFTDAKVWWQKVYIETFFLIFNVTCLVVARIFGKVNA